MTDSKDKKATIDELNSKTLFSSRKNFGMFGNIQWVVKDIKDGVLVVEVNSSSNDWGTTNDDGREIPSKEQIMKDIRESIISAIPDAVVDISWTEWKTGDGYRSIPG